MSDNPFLQEKEFAERRFETLDLKAISLTDAEFEDCAFVHCQLGGAFFKRVRLVGCVFEQCDLSNLALTGSGLRDVKFLDCKLVGVNFPQADSFTNVSFERCVLNYANFSGIDVRKSVLKDCVAREADFAEANLSETDCRGTDFTGARFTKTNLVKADFRGAKSYAIRPDDNKLNKAKFSLPEATLLLYGLDIELEE